MNSLYPTLQYSGFTCAYSDSLLTCAAFPIFTTFAALSCGRLSLGDTSPVFTTSTTVASYPVLQVDGSSASSTLALFAPLVQLVYQDSDLANAHLISEGAIAGVVLGSLIGFTFLLALIWSLLRWRRRRRKRGNKYSTNNLWSKAELSGLGKALNEASEEAELRELRNTNIVHELHDKTAIHELEVPETVHELDDRGPAQELPSGRSAVPG